MFKDKPLTRLSPRAPEVMTAFDLPGAVERTFGRPPSAAALLWDGAFGWTYEVFLQGEPLQVIVKVFKYAGFAQQEANQLAVLREHLPDLVPHVYAYCPPQGENPCDAIILERLPGISARQAFPQDRSLFSQHVFSALYALQAVPAVGGFGAFDSPGCPDAWAFYAPRMERLHAAMMQDPSAAARLTPSVFIAADTALSEGACTLNRPDLKPVLVHGDFSLGNLLIDLHSGELSGLIDPLEAHWGDPLIDAVFLNNYRPDELNLLGGWQQEQGWGQAERRAFAWHAFSAWLRYFLLFDVPDTGALEASASAWLALA